MIKKFLIVISILLCAIFTINYSFAMNEIKDATDNIGNMVENTKNGAENIARDTAGAIKEGTNKIENAGENMINDMTDNNSGTDTSTDNNQNMGYTATRTATGLFDTSNTMWTWIILAVIGAAIIGLVWYYAVQNNNSHID